MWPYVRDILFESNNQLGGPVRLYKKLYKFIFLLSAVT